jgi:16S rRNA (cytosine967-C5)-methyltransferase
MGLMAHSPDIRFARKPEDIASLTELQAELLEICSAYVKRGGRLVYSTCSINREENEGVTDAFLARRSDFEYKDKPATLYPHIDGSDGFYIAVLGRK